MPEGTELRADIDESELGLAAPVAFSEETKAFYRLADERWAQLLRDGLSVPWEEAKAWLEARAHGEHPPWPEARPFKIGGSDSSCFDPGKLSEALLG